MAIERIDTYVFEKGQLVPFQDVERDELLWASHLEEQGYAPEEQVWGQYPDAYVRVNEAKPGAAATHKFVATLNLVAFPHCILVPDLNGLIQLLHLVLPLLDKHARPIEAAGDALYGTQGADETSEMDAHLR